MANYMICQNKMMQGQKLTTKDLINIESALTGFVRAITLSGSFKDQSLQDSLRILNIWFQFGEHKRVYDIIRNGLTTIDIAVWIEVVPQLIARIDVTEKQTHDLIFELLNLIAKEHPQSIIYPVTVSAKSKNPERKRAAQEILASLRREAPNLVKQSIQISNEINRAAILLYERWYEGIEEAWLLFYEQKDIKKMIEALQEMHEESRKKPETLSEISFYQKYGMKIQLAESWLLRYMKITDETALNQAWDIYRHLFLVFKE